MIDVKEKIEKRDNSYYTKLVFQQSDSVWIVELAFQDLEVLDSLLK